MESMMIPNPACLGLEALIPSETIAYQQIQKMSNDLNVTQKQLFDQMGLLRNAHDLYIDSRRSPVAYVAAMRAMDLKQPGDLVRMYASVEDAYDTAFLTYEACVDRFVRFCNEHMTDEKYKLAYQAAIENIQLQYHNLLCLDPRANGGIDIGPSTESLVMGDVSDASMEGFFKNIIESIKHTFTRDLKCKEIMSEIAARASSASKEADDKFKSIAHEFKCPPADDLQEGIAYIGPTTKFLSERFDAFMNAHKSIFTRKMSGAEQEAYLKKFLKEHKDHFNQWGAKYGDYHMSYRKEGNYGSLGYNMKKVVQLFKAFETTSSGARSMLKKMFEQTEGHTQIDGASYNGSGVTIYYSIKKEWRLCNAHLERVLEIYDQVDYTIFRIGKDVKSCL